MATDELQGDNLGEKHHHYNKLANEITSGKSSGDFKVGGEDVENLIKIDVSSRKRDLDYILQVLKSADMLYVSRAIKQSPWLITDLQYSHIINPDYLHSQLFPTMTSKACAKLMLQIRLKLKSEDRVDVFYTYLKEKDLDKAMKWLPNCSLALIEKEVANLINKINIDIFTRLCERSISVLEKYVSYSSSYSNKRILEATKFFLKTDTEKYLDLVEKEPSYNRPSLGSKEVETIMKTCPQRIKSNFVKYSGNIDLDTFAKHLERTEIKEFLVKQYENKDMRNWFIFSNIKHFLKYMPKEGRFDFVKTFFIEKKRDTIVDTTTTTLEEDDECMDRSNVRCAMLCSASYSPSSSANIYCWYRFAPFETAYPDLTKLIRAESNSAERIAMFSILLKCAGRNPEHVRTVLQYYHDKHINEPFKFKIQFVNLIITLTPTCKFDSLTWNILNNLFHSLEVYIESEKNVQNCIEAVIVYKILHDEPLSTIVENKFKFSTLKSYQEKLSINEQEKVFGFLYDLQKSKIEKKDVKNENDFNESIVLLDEILTLLNEWKKNLADYPFVLEKITELNKVKIKNCWKSDLSSLYNKNKSWRKIMFEDSLSMWPSPETFYNALKHDPSLLSRNGTVVEELRRNDNVSLRGILRKLRIYWPKSLGAQWAELYIASLNQPGGHKALIEGICTLLPQKQLSEIIQNYVPTQSKINWGEDDELILSLRKHIAKNMHLARPQPHIDLVLQYAQGDYLQFTLPSLYAVLHNMSPKQLQEHISKILDAPVSLQKHGIRFAFTKLQSTELQKLFHEIWKKAKNPSIRAVLFIQTFRLLCLQNKTSKIEDTWQLLSLFIDKLTAEENKTIYSTLGKPLDVPLLVRGKFLMKSYKFVKTLPAKDNCESILTDLKSAMVDLMEQLDAEFVENVILENLDNDITTQRYEHTDLIVAYLLCVKDEKSQSERYKKIMLPILERCFSLWDNSKDKFVSLNVQSILEDIPRYLQRYVLQKKMVCPTKLCKDIEHQLTQRLSVETNYYLLTYWTLITKFVTALDEHKELIANLELEGAKKQDSCRPFRDVDNESTSKIKDLYIKTLPKFSDACLQQLKEDTNKYFPSVYLIFAKSLKKILQDIRPSVFYECLYELLKQEDFIQSYLLVIKLAPEFCYESGEQKKMLKNILKKIYAKPSVEVKMHFYQKFNIRALDENDDD